MRVLLSFLPKSRDLFGVYFLRRLIEKEAKLIVLAKNLFAICFQPTRSLLAAY